MCCCFEKLPMRLKPVTRSATIPLITHVNRYQRRKLCTGISNSHTFWLLSSPLVSGFHAAPSWLIKDAMIILDTRAALDGIVTTRDITVIMRHIMRIMTGVITRVITRIIIHRSRHAERALRKNSTITIIITTSGGTFGNGNTGSENIFSTMVKTQRLWTKSP